MNLLNLILGLFWASPEILRNILKEKSPQKIGSQEGDIYAAAVILKELFSRNGPYTEFEDQYTPSGIDILTSKPKKLESWCG